MRLSGFTHAYLSSLFRYNKTTGEVVRRVPRGQWPAGTVVGTIDGKGYLHVSVGRKFIRLHRLAWFLVRRETPPQVDHHNAAKTDNRWRNLRACTAHGNAGNARLNSRNTSGYRGVSRNSRSGMWHAQIKLHGKQTYLGRFDDPVSAARCYDRAARQHFGKFARLNNA